MIIIMFKQLELVWYVYNDYRELLNRELRDLPVLPNSVPSFIVTSR